MVGVGCKFALNEMRRYGAFQSEVNSFPTINCIPPPTYHPYPTLFTLASLSLCLFAVDPLALSQPSSSFSLVLHIHIVLLASRRTRHVPATYIVPPNNVCPKGREITDFDGRRISRVSSADRASRKSVRGKKRATSTTDIYEGQLARLFLSPRLWLLPVCRVINGTRNLEKATPLRQPIVSRREGATGVIGHNLVDSLIYKQSLMKFLVFINNALQPRAPVCRHRYPGIPRCFHPSPSRSSPLLYPSIFLLILRCRRFRAYHRPTPFIALAFNQPLPLAGVFWMSHRANMFSRWQFDFLSIVRINIIPLLV